MTHAETRSLALAVLAAFLALLLAACETGGGGSHVTRALPAYQPPIPHSEFQSVRTTAYTHTEADHTAYSNHNALGGQLQAAGAPVRRAENAARAIPVAMAERSDYRQVSSTGTPLEAFSLETRTVTKTTTVTKTSRTGKKVVVTTKTKVPKIGSAAADWARWPAGTTFRVLSTGQMYRVDDYGWALSGRNTIDLYMATSREMNSWGCRQEPIQVLHWGDPAESLRLLQPHQSSKHIQRMILELQGREPEAASLQ